MSVRCPSIPLLVLTSSILLATSCGKDDLGTPAPQRDCSFILWARASSPEATMGITGSWNGWNGISIPMTRQGDRWHRAIVQVLPGDHGYLVVENGVPRLDDRNPLTTFRGENEVSLLLAEDCSAPNVEVNEVRVQENGSVHVHATFLTATTGDPLDPQSLRATAFDGTPFPVQHADPDSGKIVLFADALPRGKYTITIEATDRRGRIADPARAVAWVHPAATDWQDGILYQIMTDRFLGDGGKPLAPPSTPGSRAGGTLDGVRSAIESGELQKLGVTALWLSPVYLNPTESREGPWDGRQYEGYHGYWVQQSQQVDPRLGGEQALHALVTSAHARGLRVLLDIVPNHVYETNPIFLNRRNDGWFHDGADKCVCGNPPCPWSTHIETCWFTSYLPDYRWKMPEVMRHGAEESLWWTQTFNIDGVRVDAVPMMPRAATRRIAHALKNFAQPASEQFLLGEIYTGGGQAGIDQIRYHLGPAGLDSAFDFPLMWTLRETIAYGKGSFADIVAILAASQRSYEGSGATISLIVGNHDTTRFLSEAQGDAAQDPWDNPPVQPTDPEPYARHRLAMTLVLTLPGLPTIYYGDEVGLAGGGDPDCRRVMPDFKVLMPAQVQVLEQVRTLGTLRRCSTALRKGRHESLVANASTYLYVRDAEDGWPVLTAMSTASTTSQVVLPSGAIPAGTYVDVLTGEAMVVGEGISTISLEPLSARVLISESHPCR